MYKNMIDLTHRLNDKISVYPGTEAPQFTWLNTVAEHGYAEMMVQMVLHNGTHIDAPCHIIEHSKSLSDFPIEKFAGQALVIPCKNCDAITLDHLLPFEPLLSQSEFVLFYTGWQDKWATPSYCDNCPILTREATEWLLHFALKGVGIDSFSMDHIVTATDVADDNLPNHHLILASEVLLIENLTNLHLLPETLFFFQCFPLNIELADGSPVRAVAMF
jgi:arylformamidase